MRGRLFLAVATLLAVGGLEGCARPVFPPGGPIDTIAPKIVETLPADSTVHVPLNGSVEILFSESMDRTTVRDGIRVYPPVGRQSFDWSGRRIRVIWDRPLAEHTTYTLFLGGAARDARGVPMGRALTLRFSTGDSIDRGRITGILRAKTLRRGGIPILAFPDSLGPRPDTLGVVPSYATETDTGGVYSLGGLPVDRGFTIHAFYDLNTNGSIEPDADLIVSYPTPIRLTPERVEADSVNIVAVDPRSPAILSGKIAATDSTARYRIEAVEVSDSTLFRRVERIGPGAFTLRVPAGSYRLTATRLALEEGAKQELVIRHDDPIVTKAEEEYGPIEFDFVPIEPPKLKGAAPPEDGE